MHERVLVPIVGSRRVGEGGCDERGDHGGVEMMLSMALDDAADDGRCAMVSLPRVGFLFEALRRNQYWPTSTAHLVFETRCIRRDQK